MKQQDKFQFESDDDSVKNCAMEFSKLRNKQFTKKTKSDKFHSFSHISRTAPSRFSKAIVVNDEQFKTVGDDNHDGKNYFEDEWKFNDNSKDEDNSNSDYSADEKKGGARSNLNNTSHTLTEMRMNLRRCIHANIERQTTAAAREKMEDGRDKGGSYTGVLPLFATVGDKPEKGKFICYRNHTFLLL